eukprot:g80702.t1
MNMGGAFLNPALPIPLKPQVGSGSMFFCLVLLNVITAVSEDISAATFRNTDLGFISYPNIREDPHRKADFERVIAAAKGWWSGLKVDAVYLASQGIKGVKKVGESLDLGINLLVYAKTPAERTTVMAQIAELLAQTTQSGYHQWMHICKDKQFDENSMSYLRVLKLMSQIRVETSYYRQQLTALVPRLSRRMAGRGAWQKDMFAKYYELFGLPKPPALANLKAASNHQQSQHIPNRTPLSGLQKDTMVYMLTHELYVAFEYGLSPIAVESVYSEADVAYLAKVLPALTTRYIAAQNADLVGELLTCMQYVKLTERPAYRQGLNFLLDDANADGSWGHYAKKPFMDIHLHLHTVSVVLQALFNEYYGPVHLFLPPLPQTLPPPAPAGTSQHAAAADKTEL